jgi:hypothetical protein
VGGRRSPAEGVAVRRGVCRETGEHTLWLSLDDSLCEKDPATKHVEGVDWHHDHNARARKQAAYKNGSARRRVALACRRLPDPGRRVRLLARQPNGPVQTVPDVIRLHRREHLTAFIRAIAEAALHSGSVRPSSGSCAPCRERPK